MPRIAAKLDTSQVSDIIKVESADTFVRPIYAGNAFATVKSTDVKKCITIRPTSFEPCESSGGSAPIETAEAGEEFSLTKFVKREEIKV
jgi:electron transfer flavoprotein alpha subunit